MQVPWQWPAQAKSAQPNFQYAEVPTKDALSPLLFALSLELLAQKVRQHPLVHPITFCNTEHQISLYADNIFLYIGNSGSSVPHLLAIFDSFSSIFGYKINWSKSSLMYLNSVKSQVLLPTHIPVIKTFKYLGVDIFPSMPSIALRNDIYDQIEADFKHWSKLLLSF